MAGWRRREMNRLLWWLWRGPTHFLSPSLSHTHTLVYSAICSPVSNTHTEPRMNSEWTVGRPHCPLLPVTKAKNLCLFLLVFSSNSAHTHTHTNTHTSHSPFLEPASSLRLLLCHLRCRPSVWPLLFEHVSVVTICHRRFSQTAISSSVVCYIFFFFFFSHPQRSIAYLFPSGLFEKKARPLMKVRHRNSADIQL